ncbi:MAG: cytochrome c-type biogenesis protein CcmH [Alphaproteobacteria bacterium]|nr:cytochrome c-type biogenesis protein CcmH [Alphaproteobacteria bacterium]
MSTLKMMVVLLVVLATPVWAVLPDEMLSNPVLEARARDISQGLRCLVCRNESIDDSEAGLARDLRLLLRERLVDGDSDAQAVAFIVQRYGEYVLLKPSMNGINLLLWASGPIMFILALSGGIVFIRRRKNTPEPELNPVEQARLTEILSE